MNLGVLARAVLGAAATAGTTFALLAQLGRIDFTLDQLNSGLSLLLPVLAVIAAYALRHRDRIAAAVAMVGVAVAGYQLGTAAIAPTAGDASGPSIKLLTLSTYHSNPTPEGIRQVVAAEAPDIAVLQETDRQTRLVVESLLPGFHRVKPCPWQYCSITILSRWPMRRVTIRYGHKGSLPDLLIGDVEAPFGRFRVIDVHMPRPTDSRAQSFGDDLASVARASDALPLIVAGDFNAATGSFGLNRFATQSGLRRIEGFVPTYPANMAMPAFVGIDHVFTDARWASQGCHRTKAGGSDHYGVACTLRLASPRFGSK
jgi:endonuclease/exonuclease/phosphatase family metal-dependent hydrolase